MSKRAAREKSSRYIIGIDLGTTNTVVAYADTAARGNPPIRVFEIEQLVALGEVAARPLLPSLRYHPAPGELADSDLHLPWPEPELNAQLPRGIIGTLARELGSQVPGRLVASAKSWLSHTAVDRSAPILPWGAAEDVPKISPVDASASYLAHIRAAWNHHFPQHPLEQQDVVLTVPASFDEVARTLTVEAARKVGIQKLRLVEEPQAAMYDWLTRHQQNLSAALGDARLVLVCDVGGGTTDLTLIKVTPGEHGPEFTRIGVGDHLMLGGDNMDLALAHVAEGRITASGTRLSAARLAQLVQQCRLAKERLLASDAPQRHTVTVLGTGARLIGGASSTELTRDEVRQMVVEGFFPHTTANERPQRLRGGLVEFGLPYAADPAVSRHVAAFLAHHAHASREALDERAPSPDTLPIPDAVLLNGGVFRSTTLSARLFEILASWRGNTLHELHNDQPDLAVARGAVAYGQAQRGTGPRIGGGSARSYFLIVEQAMDKTQRGICVLPRGTETGTEIILKERIFSLRLGQPVRFPLASSTADTAFNASDLVDITQDDFVLLPPIATVIDSSTATGANELPVQITALLTEVGTLDMHCVATDGSKQRWKLEFQLRGAGSAPQSMATVTDLHPRFGQAVQRIERIYGAQTHAVEKSEVKKLRGDLEQLLGPRDGWETPLLRELFGALWEGAKRRRRSADHERQWFGLTGYCLRPGFGYPLDDWRVQQLWSLYSQGVQFTPEAQTWAEWWTLWRRVAGGLDAAAQQHILDDIAYYLMPASHSGQKKPPGPKKLGYDGMVRLTGSLERLPATRKVEVGEWLLERLQKPSESAQTWWSVGRLGARVPFYGSAHNVIPQDVASHWVEQTLTANWKTIPTAAFAATLLCRVSGDRSRDLDSELREKVARKLEAAKAARSWVQMVREAVQLEAADEQRVFGETLPTGLKLLA